MTDDNAKKFPYGQLATAVKTPHQLGGQSAIDGIVQEKLHDAMTPGFEAEFSVDEADHAGAFVEDALSPDDAAASISDLLHSPSIDE